jgi:L-alanine-DL-glutamate epimerase-like enolase superfamily enzyme
MMGKGAVMTRFSEPPTVASVEAAAYTIPTDAPESDGTLAWDSTTLVVATATAAGERGIGYTYSGPAAAQVITGTLAGVVEGRDATTPAASWAAMQHAVRNLGRPGLVATAISAVDIALWDLAARLADVPMALAAGAVHDATPIYGSGGFTSYDDDRLAGQLSGWAEAGIPRVKMKVGRDPGHDQHRLDVARDAIGRDVELYVDANGAYTRKQALDFAERFRECGVTWFEEPVSSDDLNGLRLIRDRTPAGMEIAAGEYGYDAPYFRRMLAHGSVDVLQADATRCAGATGFLEAAALCHSFGLPFSAHTAPSLHAHLCCGALGAKNVEYFYDHARIERMFFDGAIQAENGLLRPDLGRPGFGLELKSQDVEKYRVYGDADCKR